MQLESHKEIKCSRKIFKLIITKHFPNLIQVGNLQIKILDKHKIEYTVYTSALIQTLKAYSKLGAGDLCRQ
jgi:hypothetical protein